METSKKCSQCKWAVPVPDDPENVVPTYRCENENWDIDEKTCWEWAGEENTQN